MKAGNGGGSIDYTARSWPDLVFPPMPRNGQMDARLCATGAAQREERSLLFSLILQEGTQAVRYPRADTLQYQWTKGYAAFSASHIPATSLIA